MCRQTNLLASRAGIQTSGSNPNSSAASNRATSATHQYINPTSGVSPSPFATQTALQTSLWPQDPTIQIHPSSLGNDISGWQSQSDFTRFNNSTSLYTPASLSSSSTFPLGPISRSSNYPSNNYHQEYQRPSLPRVGMSDYPSPQHSEVSEQAICSPHIASGNNFVPQNSFAPSNRNMSTTPIRAQDPPAAGTSPPRNAAGEIYCADPACRSNPPTFARKCEWT